MNITTLTFAGFVLATLVLFYLVPARWQNPVLLAASLFFLVTWSWTFALIAVILTAFNFTMGLLLARGGRSKRLLLWVGIGANAAALGLLKYGDTLIQNLALGASPDTLGTTFLTLKLLVPIGISYYVLQGISYLIDVSRGTLEPTRRAVDFGVYMIYFARVVSGPIERADRFLGELKRPRRVDRHVVSEAGALITVGLFRKLVIADPLFRILPEDAFTHTSSLTGPEMDLALLGFVFALYNDFAGYTEMVRGVGRLFGIELTRNFAYPLFSRNFNEFWNRWHISLSHWLRDYVYYPVSRWLLRRFHNPRNVLNLAVPALATMLVSAAWHDARLGVLLWGGINAGYLVVERVRAVWWGSNPPDKQPLALQRAKAGVTFGLAALAGVPFLAGVTHLRPAYGSLLHWGTLGKPDLRILILVTATLGLDWIQSRGEDERVFLSWPMPAKAAVLALAILAIVIATRADVGAPFIYQAF